MEGIQLPKKLEQALDTLRAMQKDAHLKALAQHECAKKLQSLYEEMLTYIKFCRNASRCDIREIHDRARDLIVKSKKLQDEKNKIENI